LFVHNELTKQNAQFGPGTSFIVNGYEKVFCEHLIELLKQLAVAMHKYLSQEMNELKENGF
jgi:hypothetical protein